MTTAVIWRILMFYVLSVLLIVCRPWDQIVRRIAVHACADLDAFRLGRRAMTSSF